MVLSNTVILEPRNCFNSTVHVDPEYSLLRYRKYPTQTLRKTGNVPFWLVKNNIEIFHLDHLVCQTLEEKIELDLLEKFSLGVEDKLMNEFITEKKMRLLRPIPLKKNKLF